MSSATVSGISISYPRRALRAAISLIAVECLMLAIPSHNWIITGTLLLCAVSRWWTIRRGWFLPMPLTLNSVFLATLFVLKYSFAPASFLDATDFANTTLAHEIGCWLVSVQILMLHEPTSLKRIPVAFTALGCLAVLCAGDIRLHNVSRFTTLVLMILFVGGLGWFAHTGRDWIKVDQSRRLRRYLMLITLILAGVPMVFAAHAWHQHERDLETLLINLMKAFEGQSAPRRYRSHSALAQVTSGKIYDPERLVLQVTSPSPEPLYLRGVILDLYGANSMWTTRKNPVAVLPREVPPDRGLPTQEPLFPITESHATQWSTVQINFLTQEEPIPLTLLDTAEMRIAVGELQIDEMKNVRLNGESLPASLAIYTPLAPEADEPPPLDDRTRGLPKSLDARIVSMAFSICRGKTTDSDKIQAIESYFRENYLYQIGFEAPGPEDRVSYFLLHQPRPAAHCEYFASGAALLLRAVGVPTRYVTGFVPSERRADGTWIARRKDAHAWAEAYDAELGRWVTVEATPSVGLPERRYSSLFDEIWSVWRNGYRSFQEKWSVYGTWSAISELLQSIVARIFLVFVLIASWWGLSRRYRQPTPENTAVNSSRAYPFREWLREVESDLARQGFERRPQETLLQFRNRILASPANEPLHRAADWYAAYSSIRYNESGQTSARIAELEQSWRNLIRQSANNRSPEVSRDSANDSQTT